MCWYSPLFVCRRWYQIMIETPRMWDLIDLSSTPSCVKVMLSRSQNVPLRVQPTSFKPGNPLREYGIGKESLTAIFEQSHRIRDLQISVTETVVEVLASFRSQPLILPIVSTLTVHNEISPLLIFPFALSLDRVTLRSLWISGYPFEQVQTLLVPTIQNVALRLPYDDDADSRTVLSKSSTVLKALSALLLLENAEVKGWLYNEGGTSHSPQRLSFPNLQTLTLHLFFPNFDFLNCISCPKRKHICLTTQCGNLDKTILLPLLESLFPTPGRLLDSSGGVICALKINIQSEGWSFKVTYWDTPTRHEDFFHDSTASITIPCLELDVEFDDYIYIIEACEEVIRHIVPSDIQTLALSYAPSSEGILPILMQTLSQLTNLQTLVTREWSDEHLAEALSFIPETTPSPSDTVRQVIFPKLQDVLVLRPFYPNVFRESAYNPYMQSHDRERLRKMMELRKLCGSPSLRFHTWKKEQNWLTQTLDVRQRHSFRGL